jgi:hypothetical protein
VLWATSSQARSARVVGPGGKMCLYPGCGRVGPVPVEERVESCFKSGEGNWSRSAREIPRMKADIKQICQVTQLLWDCSSQVAALKGQISER